MAENIVAKLGKPPKKVAGAMRKLFNPSGTKFNPHAECVASSAHSKKKKFKASSITVFMLRKFQKKIPRGEQRQKLLAEKRERKVSLDKGMTAAEVRDAISKAFKCNKFTILESRNYNELRKCSEELTGELAVTKRATLYVCEEHEVSW